MEESQNETGIEVTVSKENRQEGDINTSTKQDSVTNDSEKSPNAPQEEATEEKEKKKKGEPDKKKKEENKKERRKRDGSSKKKVEADKKQRKKKDHSQKKKGEAGEVKGSEKKKAEQTGKFEETSENGKEICTLATHEKSSDSIANESLAVQNKPGDSPNESEIKNLALAADEDKDSETDRTKENVDKIDQSKSGKGKEKKSKDKAKNKDKGVEKEKEKEREESTATTEKELNKEKVEEKEKPKEKSEIKEKEEEKKEGGLLSILSGKKKKDSKDKPEKSPRADGKSSSAETKGKDKKKSPKRGKGPVENIRAGGLEWCNSLEDITKEIGVLSEMESHNADSSSDSQLRVYVTIQIPSASFLGKAFEQVALLVELGVNFDKDHFPTKLYNSIFGGFEENHSERGPGKRKGTLNNLIRISFRAPNRDIDAEKDAISKYLDAALGCEELMKCYSLRHFLGIKITNDYKLLLGDGENVVSWTGEDMIDGNKENEIKRVTLYSGSQLLEEIEAGTESELLKYVRDQEEAVRLALQELATAQEEYNRDNNANTKKNVDSKNQQLEEAEVLLEALQTNLQAWTDHVPQPQLNYSGKKWEDEAKESMERELKRKVNTQEQIVAQNYQNLQKVLGQLSAQPDGDEKKKLEAERRRFQTILEESETLLEALQGNLQAFVDNRVQPQFLYDANTVKEMHSRADPDFELKSDNQKKAITLIRGKIDEYSKKMADTTDEGEKEVLKGKIAKETDQLKQNEELFKNIVKDGRTQRSKSMSSEDLHINRSTTLNASANAPAKRSASKKKKGFLEHIQDGDVHQVRKEVKKTFFDVKSVSAKSNKDGYNCLTLASKLGYKDIVSELLEAGFKPDIVDKKGRTPLYCACLSGHTDIVELLIKEGANIDVICEVDGVKDTPLDVSIRTGNHSCMIELGKPPGEWLCTALINSEFDVAQVLAERPGIYTDYVDSSGWTTLHHAMKFGQEKVVIALASAGASIQLKNKVGKTAADIAKQYSHENLVQTFSTHHHILNPFAILENAKKNYSHVAMLESQKAKQQLESKEHVGKQTKKKDSPATTKKSSSSSSTLQASNSATSNEDKSTVPVAAELPKIIVSKEVNTPQTVNNSETVEQEPATKESTNSGAAQAPQENQKSGETFDTPKKESSTQKDDATKKETADGEESKINQESENAVVTKEAAVASNIAIAEQISSAAEGDEGIKLITASFCAEIRKKVKEDDTMHEPCATPEREGKQSKDSEKKVENSQQKAKRILRFSQMLRGKKAVLKPTVSKAADEVESIKQEDAKKDIV